MARPTDTLESADGFIYMEIASSLRGRIVRGDFTKGRLPSERQLTAEFGVQRGTVRRALKELEDEGLVYRDATRGTYTRPTGARGAYAAALAANRGIALVVGRADDTTAPGDIARGLSRAAYDAGRGVLWVDAPAAAGHAEAPVPAAGDLVARGVGAAVLWPQIPADTEALRALRDAMPLVLLDRHVPGFESDFVGINDFGAGRQITEHLLALGHRRIAFLSAAPDADTVRERYRGHVAALEATGVRARPEWVLHRAGEFRRDDDAAIGALLDGAGSGGPLTAAVCANDSVAAAAIGALRRLGRRVPDDVAVTGFGNSFPQLLDALGLTTVAQPWEEMGRAAAEIALRRMLDGRPAPVEEVNMPVQIVVRGSCGAPVLPEKEAAAAP